MSFTIVAGTSVAIAVTYGTAIAMSALSNAAEAVATLVRGLADGIAEARLAQAG